jgi:membrane protein DedA with SNARE-associated domain
LNDAGTPNPRDSYLPTRWHVAGGVVLLIAVIVGIGFLIEHDVTGEVVDADASIGALLRQYGYLGGFALIYIEETGIPLFIPGDVFLLYVGSRLPHEVPIVFAAWLGFVLAVTLGSTNLYLLSRRFGRRLIEHRLARLLHITPERVAEAEQWFRRYGPWALIFGRHIPGFRVPLTVVAGLLELPYPVFAVSVAVSSAIWAGVFLILGVMFGSGIERSIRSNLLLFGEVAAGIVVVVALVALVRARRQPHAGPRP